ncbi:MAG: S-methyl-5-thioribose-1-phosphate isomerase [Anaerolineae bacterium]|nr:S-methyl-5-thioribose-1-phosphate isomerase [Anaerolineae bacterium]NIN96553.1 S-methyl-5-thioribose-1-phosphate isomerase [Anaerolineae bacterium]NIQ79582.1 S-methyl-5-thioribose-1-phosphate isomerase [Anaerolineae bacterium]
MRTIEWRDGVVRMIDQRKLPHEYVEAEFTDYRDVARAIKEMYIRGAPAIGAAAAYGVALAAVHSSAQARAQLLDELEEAGDVLRSTRPTASNLFWAVDRMLRKAAEPTLRDTREIREALVAEAEALADEDVEVNKRMGSHGAELIEDGYNILTHCNAGALATVDYGTALAPIRTAWKQGKRLHVFVDETRPRLQGARLTAWELMQEGIPMTLIADSAAGYFIQAGKVDIIFVGADRVVANGDVVNKIGTYKLAVVAKENGVPFYAVVPTSTIDLSIESGEEVPIEERDPGEVTRVRDQPIAPEGVGVANPAFDVTPFRYVTGIITEGGIVYPPFPKALRIVVEENRL